jgi:hypothetical protein
MDEQKSKEAAMKPGDLEALLKALEEVQKEAEFEYPITVTLVEKKGRFVAEGRTCPCGTLVKIRPVVDEGEQPRTYLGIYIGDIATDVLLAFADDRSSLIAPKRGVLKLLVGGNNPAIFVPALRRLVFGYESWWGPIKSPEEAEEAITDEDIENVPYVKALRAMMEAEEKKNADTREVQQGG